MEIRTKKKMTAEEKERLTIFLELTELITKEVVKHFAGFMKDKGMEKEFSAYCEKKPMTFKLDVEKGIENGKLEQEDDDDKDVRYIG